MVAGTCTARYTLTHTPAGAIVRVLGIEHEGHNTRTMARHVASWCREFIREEFYERDGPSPRELVKAVRAEALQRGLKLGRKTEPELTEDELTARWLKRDNTGQFRREFLITRKQVRDEIRAYERDKSELMPDEAESIFKWATDTHKDDTLIYEPGEDTPDDQPENVRPPTRFRPPVV